MDGVWRDILPADAAARAGVDALANLRQRIERAGHDVGRYAVEVRVPQTVADALAADTDAAASAPLTAWRQEATAWQAIDYVAIADAVTPPAKTT
ncbi:MAG: hypothetical protein R2854_15985 [Caldilineaceae bacterium]